MLTFGIIGLVLSLVILFLWGVVGIRFQEVPEGTASVFKYAQGYAMTVMQFEGYLFDENGFIKPEKDFTASDKGSKVHGSCWCIWVFRGWVFYSSWFVEVVLYEDQNEPDKFGGGASVYLNDRQTEMSEKGIYTKDNIAMDVDIVSTERVRNVRKFMFASPKDVIKQTNERELGAMRSLVKSQTEQEVQENRGNGQELWRLINEKPKLQASKTDPQINYGPIFDSNRDDWGVEIVPEKILITHAVPSDEQIRTALEQKRKAWLEAKANLLRQKIDAKADAQEILGPMLAALALTRNKSPKDIQADLRDNPELEKRLLDYMQEINAQLLKADKNAFFELKSSGNPILDAITLYRQLAGGNGGQQSPQTGGNPGNNPGKNPSGGQSAPPLPPFKQRNP